jgi:integrase
MLEDFFTVPAAAQPLRSSLFGEHLDEFCTSAMGRRDYAVLLLLARLGMRASEVVALELGDLRWEEGEIVVRGKGLIRDRLPCRFPRSFTACSSRSSTGMR